MRNQSPQKSAHIGYTHTDHTRDTIGAMTNHTHTESDYLGTTMSDLVEAMNRRRAGDRTLDEALSKAQNQAGLTMGERGKVNLFHRAMMRGLMPPPGDTLRAQMKRITHADRREIEDNGEGTYATRTGQWLPLHIDYRPLIQKAGWTETAADCDGCGEPEDDCYCCAVCGGHIDDCGCLD